MGNVNFVVADIFKVNVADKYDAVVSNGLNIYLKTNQQVKDFYQIVSDSLKSDGTLITSFLNDPSGVNISNINPINMSFAKNIFIDLLDIGWKKTHTEGEFVELLKECGFNTKEIIYDTDKMFPTVVAIKK